MSEFKEHYLLKFVPTDHTFDPNVGGSINPITTVSVDAAGEADQDNTRLYRSADSALAVRLTLDADAELPRVAAGSGMWPERGELILTSRIEVYPAP
jgi:hypothetical protein